MTHTYIITDFGASVDAADNTLAIQQAVDAAHLAGGGMVIVPPGMFRTGTVWLKSNVHLDLAHGATLKGADAIEAFYAGGIKRGMIMAYEARNITLSGGTIDGNGTHFHIPGRRHSSRDIDPRLTRQGDAYLTDTTGQPDGPIAYTRRPGMMVVFKSCENVHVEDITLCDSPEWTLRFSECDRVWVDGITIDDNLMIPNSDGVHLTTCSNVFINNCSISAGDDAIAVTGFTNAIGVDPLDGSGQPIPEAQSSTTCGNRSGVCQNIIVSNCVLRSRSAGVRVGYGDSPVRHCQFHHLRIFDTNRGLGVFARDGAAIEHISFSDITMDLRLIGGWWGHGEPLHISSIAQNADRPGGVIRDVRFERITARAENGAVLWSEDPGAIQDVRLRDVDLTLHAGAQSGEFGGNFDLRPTNTMATSVFSHDIPGLFMARARDVDIDGFRLRWEGDLPGYFSHGIEAVGVDHLRVRDYQGSPAHPKDEILHLTDCTNLDTE